MLSVKEVRLQPARREFLTAAAAICCGCSSGGAAANNRDKPLFEAKPGKAATGKSGLASPGVHRLGLRQRRDATLYVPENLPVKPGLVVYLHGATGSEEQGPKRLGALAEKLGFLLLSPASAERTWDAIRNGYGGDVRFVDQALQRTFAAFSIDPARLVLAGFSDGASYGLGLAVRDRVSPLFSAAVAFSPGFIPGGDVTPARKDLRVYISHGTGDEILPIESCSRRLVPALRKSGYEVLYKEFDGPHTFPPEIAEAGFRWALGGIEKKAAGTLPHGQRTTTI